MRITVVDFYIHICVCVLRYFALCCTICTYFQWIYGVLCGRLALVLFMYTYKHTHSRGMLFFCLRVFIHSIFAVFSRNFIFNKMKYTSPCSARRIHDFLSCSLFLTKKQVSWKLFVSCIFIFLSSLYPLAVRFFARSVNNLFLSFFFLPVSHFFSVSLTCMYLYVILYRSSALKETTRKEKREKRRVWGYEWAYKRWNAYII